MFLAFTSDSKAVCKLLVQPGSPTSSLLESYLETPVSLSWFNNAWCIGHAPLYFGNIEGCMTSIPLGNASITLSGIIRPKDAITPMSKLLF